MNADVKAGETAEKGQRDSRKRGMDRIFSSSSCWDFQRDGGSAASFPCFLFIRFSATY